MDGTSTPLTLTTNVFLTEALIIQHPRNHLRESQKKSEGQRQRRFQTCRQFKHSLASRKRQKTNTLTAENLERVPITRTSLLLKIMIIVMKTRVTVQPPVKPAMTRKRRRSSGRRRWWGEWHVFLICGYDDVTVFEAAELDASALLADTCANSTLHKYSTYRVALHDHISSRVAQELTGSGLDI